MELVRHKIQAKRGQTITILPIGDIQWAGDADEVALNLLHQAIDYGMSQKAWFLGMGDYTDPLSPSNRQRLTAANLYDTAKGFIDRSTSALVKELYQTVLKPTKGRWLGCLSGHHFHQYESGDTSDQELCRLLEAKFLGSCAYVGLAIGDVGRPYGMVNIWCHHGVGSGQSASAPVQKIESVVYGEWEADIYIIGHHTKVASVPKNRVYPVWDGIPHLSHRKKVLVGSGGFSKAYVEGARQGRVPRGGYVEQRMMKPVVLGCPIIRIVPQLRVRDSRQSGAHRTWDPQITVET
jgi:hypothetical protein